MKRRAFVAHAVVTTTAALLLPPAIAPRPFAAAHDAAEFLATFPELRTGLSFERLRRALDGERTRHGGTLLQRHPLPVDGTAIAFRYAGICCIGVNDALTDREAVRAALVSWWLLDRRDGDGDGDLDPVMIGRAVARTAEERSAIAFADAVHAACRVLEALPS